MTRKSTWLPGQNPMHPSREPGRDSDGMGFGYAQPGRTPLEDVISGLMLVGGAVATFFVGLSMGMMSILGALITFSVVATAFVGTAIWLFVRAHRRQSWRRKYARRTGTPLLRAWERTP